MWVGSNWRIHQRYLSYRELPIAAVKSYEIDALIIGYHVNKTPVTPCTGEDLCSAMESKNLMDKYVAMIQKNDGKVFEYLKQGKSGKLAKIIF